MIKTADLEKTLPLNAPPVRAREGLGWDVGPILVYTTAAQSTNQRSRLLATLHEYDLLEEERVQLAPNNFSNASLLDVYQAFIHARDEEHQRVHPTIFLVADEADTDRNGLLIVCLRAFTQRDDLDDYVIGVSRRDIREAGLTCINLEIGNTDWYEVKCSERAEWSGQSAENNERLFHPNRHQDD
ncbi:hypothetical protein Q7P37_011634 [Cladosporium fusiforme]